MVKYLAVTALLATDKENEVVRLSKAADVIEAIGYLTTDGIVILESDVGCDALLDGFHD